MPRVIARRPLALIAIAMLPLLLSACSVVYPLGVTVTEDKSTVVFPACAKVRVYAVGLTSNDGDGYTQYWTINSEAGSTLTEFVIGETPPGFVERRPLREPAAGASVAAWVDPHGDGPGPVAETGFTWGELEQDRIWSNGQFVTGEDLRSGIGRSLLCDDGLLGFGRGMDVFLLVLGSSIVVLVVVSHFTSRWFLRRDAVRRGDLGDSH